LEVKEGNRSMKRSFSFLVCGAMIYGGTLLPPATAASAKDGEAVYTAKCKSCHGADGSGNPAIAKMMNVTMKPLGSETDAEIKTAVTAGIGKMKPVTTVAGADFDNVVAYVHTLK
jgi:mono/diheme cytochrome c family protein